MQLDEHLHKPVALASIIIKSSQERQIQKGGMKKMEQEMHTQRSSARCHIAAAMPDPLAVTVPEPKPSDMNAVWPSSIARSLWSPRTVCGILDCQLCSRRLHEDVFADCLV